MRSGRPILLLLASVAVLTGGCAFENHRRELAQLHAVGNYTQAAATLDDPKIKHLYDDIDELVYHMDRGAIALAMSDYPKASEELLTAERQTEFDYNKPVGDTVASWLLNDTVTRYIAEPYEDVYLSVLQMATLLAQGRVDPGAVNEARKLGTKGNFLRDRYNKMVEAVGDKSAQASSLARASKTDVDFVESPLGLYLAAVCFAQTGERDNQRIVAEHLADVLRTQKPIVGPVNEQDFAALAQLTPDDGNVLVLAFSGRGPTKRAERLGPIPIDKLNFYVEIPVLEKHPSSVGRASVEVESGAQSDLAFIEDLSGVAEANYARTLPLVQAKAIARTLIKTGAAYAVTETVDKSSGRNGWARWGAQLSLLALQAVSERADIRGWTFLPGQARVSLLKLSPGTHRLRVAYRTFGGGTVYTSEWKTVQVPERGLATVVTHYWN